ncbi:tetratricopeptide repeat protein [Polaribacter sp. Hel1_85]|uniref:tetratricopeptide repeat protein n=1 Tax=Polaribacter sp. Hel1_85 TaxID=1250005 RepID=UPI00052BDB9D|nr:hypothetical protein [Polaribacter sp. Hel1_85]KGL64006.1 hypothetical protein PHEL85_1048 [Polaribacter sp. Hel1_85]
MGKQILCIVLLWFVSTTNAQKTSLEIKEIDSITYALFLKEDWKPILKIGKQANAEGIDFYYLKVRMGIAYFKENKMFSAIQFLEEAYNLDTSNVVVQDYLYWAYRYSGLIMESRLFYRKMATSLQEITRLKEPLISSINFNVLATNNLDYDDMLVSDADSETIDVRFIRKSQQMFSIGMSHSLFKRINFYHQFTFIPTNSVQQVNVSGVLENETYKGTESRYYADVTIALGNKWYFDAYANVISGKYDNLNPIDETSASEIKYNNLVFGGSITKASYFMRNSINVSVSDLNGLDQFQVGYSMSLYPLGSTMLVPFGSIQYKSQDDDSNMIYTAGVAVTIDKLLLTGFGSVGNMNNYTANNGLIIYNQPATGLNEFGGTIKYFSKNSILKVGYSFMNMEDNYYDEYLEVTSKKFEFNQQNIIAGITWIF